MNFGFFSQKREHTERSAPHLLCASPLQATSIRHGHSKDAGTRPNKGMRLSHSFMDDYLTIDRLNAVSSTPSSIQPVNGWETKSSANACGVQVWPPTILEGWVRLRSCRRRIRTMRSLTRRKRIDRRKSVSQRPEGRARQRRSGQPRVCRSV